MGRRAQSEPERSAIAGMTGWAAGFDDKQKAKGPAEVAASPSHGPNNPEQEKAMDVRSDTTEAADAARPQMPADLLMGMEDAVWNAALAAELVDYVAAQAIGDVLRDEVTKLTPREADLLLFATMQAKKATEVARDAYGRVFAAIRAMEAA